MPNPPLEAQPFPSKGIFFFDPPLPPIFLELPLALDRIHDDCFGCATRRQLNHSGHCYQIIFNKLANDRFCQLGLLINKTYESFFLALHLGIIN